MQTFACVVPMARVAGLTLLAACLMAGCAKTKVDQGAALLEQMSDLYLEAVEDYFDLVDDNYDICNKCVRATSDLVAQREGMMQTLLGQWTQLKEALSTKEQRDAIGQATKAYEGALREVDELKQKHYETFEEFNNSCPEHMPVVYQTMERVTGMLPRMVGPDFY